MTRQPALDQSLLAAGILTASMGLYHFWLPAQFGWGEDLAKDRMLQWALLSIKESLFCSTTSRTRAGIDDSP